MCGIFGFSAKNKNKFKKKEYEKIIETLFKLSESRGKEAAGLAVKRENSIDVLKSPLAAADFIKTKEYKKFINGVFDFSKITDSNFAIIGHSRLATHGSEYDSNNNQPIIKDGAVCVHNGIIVNNEELWLKFPELKKESEVDTEVFLALLKKFLRQTDSLNSAVSKVFEEMEGSASVAILFNNIPALLLATNTGSLYECVNDNKDALVFGSESYILEEFSRKTKKNYFFSAHNIKQIKPGSGIVVDLTDFSFKNFYFSGEKKQTNVEMSFVPVKEDKINDYSENVLVKSPIGILTSSDFKIKSEARREMEEVWKNIYTGHGLKRCVKCLLPQSMTFIEFDERGVCNYCRDYKKIETLGEDELEKIVSKHRRSDGKPDCLAPFSGGRDSSYGLHYLKNVLKMHPVAYTFDWGVLTDLGRRNEARICGELGIEHIIISADIRKKRRNIRKNIEAWLKRPELGMIPLFMAGDKELLMHAEWLMKKMRLNVSIDCCTKGFEDDLIKIGLAGIKLGHGEEYNYMSLKNKASLAKYYFSQYIINPSYINKSIADTAFASYCAFVYHPKSIHLYGYIKWEEEIILSTIINKYKWEKAKDTIATWRIDDGTAPFYNYIYMAAAGITENDIFRSIQIREGQINREDAGKIVAEENKPRFDAIEWYAKTIGFDINHAIKIINTIPKRYELKNK